VATTRSSKEKAGCNKIEARYGEEEPRSSEIFWQQGLVVAYIMQVEQWCVDGLGGPMDWLIGPVHGFSYFLFI